MNKNGEDVQSKVVAEVKQTTVALYEACTFSRILILSSRPIMSIAKKYCGKVLKMQGVVNSSRELIAVQHWCFPEQ